MSSPPPIRRAPDFPVDYIHGCGAQFLRWYFRLSARMRIDYQGPLPKSGYVLVGNHRSFFDPLAVGCALRRRIHYFARRSLWNIAPIRWVLNLFGGIPVDRRQPQSTTMKAAVHVLREGRPLLMFPEGTRTRSGRLGPLREGPALIARRGGVPIVPLFLVDSDGCWPRGAPLPIPGRGKVRIVFGPVFYSNPQIPARQRDQELMQRVTGWMQQQQRRYYPSLGTAAT